MYFCIKYGNNIDVDKTAFKKRYFATLNMTISIWINSYIIA